MKDGSAARKRERAQLLHTREDPGFPRVYPGAGLHLQHLCFFKVDQSPPSWTFGIFVVNCITDFAFYFGLRQSEGSSDRVETTTLGRVEIATLGSQHNETGSIPDGDAPHIFACGHHAGRCRWSVGFLGDLQFSPSFHPGAAPYSPRFTLIGSKDLDWPAVIWARELPSPVLRGVQYRLWSIAVREASRAGRIREGSSSHHAVPVFKQVSQMFESINEYCRVSGKYVVSILSIFGLLHAAFCCKCGRGVRQCIEEFVINFSSITLVMFAIRVVSMIARKFDSATGVLDDSVQACIAVCLIGSMEDLATCWPFSRTLLPGERAHAPATAPRRMRASGAHPGGGRRSPAVRWAAGLPTCCLGGARTEASLSPARVSSSVLDGAAACGRAGSLRALLGAAVV
ncbi:hypothetical protein PR048_009970 [Dryococelus australis]|uniref:Uncharacterized protein n=1 Tax=Dryococelus australis TaxID=614101 RepID=A0ABQ9I1E2_9NEOP|nr:hypothetical protein PR048_009970 [Dryococelus australis]